MNSYIWRFFEKKSSSRVISCILTWAVIARIDEAAALYASGHISEARIVNRPLGYPQFLDALERVVLDNDLLAETQKEKSAQKLREQLLPPDKAGSSKSRRILLKTFEEIVQSETLEGITTAACARWLFRIIENNELFARKFFTEEFTRQIFTSHSNPVVSREKFTEYFHKYVVNAIINAFEIAPDEADLEKVLLHAKMSGIPPAKAGSIRRGSREDLLSRTATVLFALQKRICPGISKAFPVHFSAWSLVHVCVATDERDSLSSDVFLVGRESRGTGTPDHGREVRVVRDAIFSFVPNRENEGGGAQPQDPLREAGFVSGEDRICYWLSGFPATTNGIGKKPEEKTIVWWEYSGHSTPGDMKLFFFAQHVEPRALGNEPGEPRIFNALILGHIRSATRGDVPGVWIALVKRLKNYVIPFRSAASVNSGLWRGLKAQRNDASDIVFTSECLCFHQRLDEITEFYHHCGLVGKITDQADTEAAIAETLNATYGFGEDISERAIGFPMQLAANFFVISEGDRRYRLIDDVFFNRKTII